MTGLVKIAAPPKFVCCVREQMLREHTLHQQKVGLSRDVYLGKRLHECLLQIII
jgi:hypothetical protein